MRELRQAHGMSLTDAAQAAGTTKGHLSHVELGRDRPSWEVIAFCEDRFNADSQLWTVFTEAAAGADITPDAVIMPPGFRFEKIWRIRNSGTVTWTGRWLRRLGPPAGLGIPCSPTQVPIAVTMPG